MNYLEIHQALDALLESVPNIPKLQKENIRITIGSGSKAWCRSTMIPNNLEHATVGIEGYDRKNGIYIIDLFYSGDSGYGDAYAFADSLLKVFKSGLQVSNSLRIIKGYPRAGYSGAPNYFTVPVVIEFEDYSLREI